jgi:HK97 family phage portal protein
LIRETIANWLLKAAKQAGGASYVVSNFQDKMAHYNTWSTDRAVKEGYKASTWVYACVRKKADQLASVPLVVHKKVGKRKVEWVRVQEHPLEILLQRPNPKMTGSHLSKALTTYLNLSGNNYWYILEVGGLPVELWPLRPDRIAPIPSKIDFISGYEYNLSGAIETIDAHEISHCKFFDPGDDFLGMGPLMAAAKAVDTDNEARDWNKNSMENRAVPPGGYSTELTLTDPQYERLDKEIKERAGIKKARKEILLDGGLKYQSFALSPVEMDFIESRKFGVVEICAPFGVDPILIGYNEHSSYNNYETAKRSLWEDTLIPELEDVVSQINHDLTPRFGDQYWVEPDLSDVPALQQKFGDRVKDGQGLWAMGVPFSKINERLELGMDDVKDADMQFIPANMIPLHASDDDEGEGEEEDPKSWGSPELKIFNLTTSELRVEHWKSFEKTRTGWYKATEKRIKKRFKDEKKAVLKNLGDDPDEMEKKAEGILSKQKKTWINLTTKIDIDVIGDFGKRISEGFKSAPGYMERKEFDVFDEGVKAWIAENVGEKIPEILDTTLSMVKEEIADGIEAGETIPEISKRIGALYDKFAGYRSTLIARTEVISTSNAGSHFAAKQTGLKLKKGWLATPGKRTRATHQKADGQTKKMDEPFIVGGAKLMFPGDSSLGAPAKEVIQCRCTQTYETVR